MVSRSNVLQALNLNVTYLHLTPFHDFLHPAGGIGTSERRVSSARSHRALDPGTTVRSPGHHMLRIREGTCTNY